MKKLILAFTCLLLAIPSAARVIIVKPNGTGDYPTIQDAINNANNGDIIEAQPGTYTGTGNQDIDFLGKSITVKSANGPTSCIIDSGFWGRGFYFHNREGANSVLEGFTITNGFVFDCDMPEDGGAGICIYNSSPTIRNCIITRNQTELYPYCLGFCYGGGINIRGNSSPMFINCIISDNSIGDFGTGGGIYCESLGTLKIRNCIISGNTAAGGSYWTNGGGIFACGVKKLIIIKSTIANNMTTGSIGGIAGGDNTSILNSIIWGNTGSQISTGDKNIIIIYNDIQGGWQGIGVGNIDADPLFANPAGGDYHLRSQAGRWNPNSKSWVIDANTSPCIDAGIPTYGWTAELWPNGKRINMGAYGGTPEASMSLSDVGNIADLDNDDFVDYNDLKLYSENWLNQQVLLPEDLDRNGFIDFVDYAIFANNW